MSAKNSNANIPFLKAKVNYAVTGIIALALANDIFHSYTDGWSWVMLFFNLSLIIIATAMLRSSQRYLNVVASIQNVLLRTNKGELYHRITGTRGMGELGKVAWELNETLDIMESYFKEINTCFEKISKGNHDRYVLADGFPGLLKTSAKSVNNHG